MNSIFYSFASWGGQNSPLMHKFSSFIHFCKNATGPGAFSLVFISMIIGTSAYFDLLDILQSRGWMQIYVLQMTGI